MGALGPQTVTRSGAWSASDSCLSSQRGNAQTLYYAKRYTFTLQVDAEVTIDLSSSRDTYLYLLAGHGSGGARLYFNDDASGSTHDSHLSVDLAAGDYTFCHQMVRSLVGLLVAIGRGQRNLADMPRIVEARNRAAAPSPAPPHGLVLWAALYDRNVATSGLE